MKRSLILAALLLASACSPVDPAAQFAAARKAYAAEDYALARTAVLSALDGDSTNREMLLLLARSQLRLADGDGAQATLVRLEEAGLRSAEIVRMKAEAALLRGQPEAVLTMLGTDADPEAWRLRAAAHTALEDSPAALDALRRGLAAGPRSYALVHDYAAFLLSAEDYTGAAKAVATLRALGPNRLDTLMLAGQLAEQTDRMDEAKRAYSAAADVYPTRIEPLIALAGLADMQGQVDAAIVLVERAAKLVPANPAVTNLRVQLAAEKGDWETVRQTLAPMESALDARSPNAMLYAEALLALGHPEQARALFAQALQLSAQNPYARLMLAEAQLATGDAATALRTVAPLSGSVLAGPRELDLAMRAAKAAGDPSAAALSARLNSPQLKQTMQLANAGLAALNRQDWAGALAVYRQIPGHENDPQVLRRLAEAAAKAGQADAAISYADRALDMAPRDADMLHVAGLVRLDSGRDRDRMLRLMQEAARLDPANRLFRADLARASAAAG